MVFNLNVSENAKTDDSVYYKNYGLIVNCKYSSMFSFSLIIIRGGVIKSQQETLRKCEREIWRRLAEGERRLRIKNIRRQPTIVIIWFTRRWS